MPLAKVTDLRKGVLHLRTRGEFERVRREGQAWSHRLLVLIACRNEMDVTRVGVAAGKKLGGAVVRNRVKRLMREAVRRHAPRMAPGWDVLLIARAAMTPVKLHDVAGALELLLQQAGLVV
jgi:ribonuclease P protein component